MARSTAAMFAVSWALLGVLGGYAFTYALLKLVILKRPIPPFS